MRRASRTLELTTLMCVTTSSRSPTLKLTTLMCVTASYGSNILHKPRRLWASQRHPDPMVDRSTSCTSPDVSLSASSDPKEHLGRAECRRHQHGYGPCHLRQFCHPLTLLGLPSFFKSKAFLIILCSFTYKAYSSFK